MNNPINYPNNDQITDANLNGNIYRDANLNGDVYRNAIRRQDYFNRLPTLNQFNLFQDAYLRRSSFANQLPLSFLSASPNDFIAPPSFDHRTPIENVPFRNIYQLINHQFETPIGKRFRNPYFPPHDANFDFFI